MEEGILWGPVGPRSVVVHAPPWLGGYGGGAHRMSACGRLREIEVWLSAVDQDRSANWQACKHCQRIITLRIEQAQRWLDGEAAGF